MNTTFTFSTTTERLEKLTNDFHFKDTSAGINTALDKFFELADMNPAMDFMYMISMPLFLFLIGAGLTLYTPNIYFYVVTGFAGIYLMIFIFMYYNKYKGVKWQKK